MRFLQFSSLFALALSRPTGSSFDAAKTVVKYVDSTSTAYQWDAEFNSDFTIHHSCNDTQSNQIMTGLGEAVGVASHAKDHILKFGQDETFQKFFGNSTTAEVIGWYDIIANGDKTGYIFRCDNPDGNCDIECWAGHWRGENATKETVICDLSYTSRRYLSQLCSQGYTVSGAKDSIYWAGDLLHRILHLPLGQNAVDHFADLYDECLELAEHEPGKAVKNSNTLRYFALEVYAYDITAPGTGCSGYDEDHEHSHSNEEESSAISALETSTSTSEAEESASSTKTDSQEISKTSTGGTECHTHSNGDVHCL